MPSLVFICSSGAGVDSAGNPTCAPGFGAWIEHKSFFEQEIPAEQVPLLLGAIFLFFAVLFVARKAARVFGW